MFQAWGTNIVVNISCECIEERLDYDFVCICLQHHGFVSHAYECLFSCKLYKVASSRVRYSKFVYRPLAELRCTQSGPGRLSIFPCSGTNHTQSSVWTAFHLPLSKDDTGGNENTCLFFLCSVYLVLKRLSYVCVALCYEVSNYELVDVPLATRFLCVVKFSIVSFCRHDYSVPWHFRSFCFFDCFHWKACSEINFFKLENLFNPLTKSIRIWIHFIFQIIRNQSNCQFNAWVMKALCILQRNSVHAETARFSPRILAFAVPAVNQSVVSHRELNNEMLVNEKN